MVLKWERIGKYEYRAKIRDGWLVKSEYFRELPEYGGYGGIGLTFVSDPEYKWIEESDLTPEMEKYEKRTGKKAKWRGKVTKQYKIWKKER